jgi:poly(A) polymerase
LKFLLARPNPQISWGHHGRSHKLHAARTHPSHPQKFKYKNLMKFSLKDRKLLKAIYRFAKAKKVKLYLVGGVLRDLILGKEKENPDFDFCLKKGAINFASKLAKKIKAGFVILDKEHGACRLVKRIKDKICTLDFTDFRGPTLEKDLLHRDFTINAIALELEKVFACEDLNNLLIDPYRGREDLKNKKIKAVNKKSFAEDPLRILRAFSFAAGLGFEIDKETLRLVKFEKDKLSKVSNERIRDELFKIFDTSRAFKCLVMLDKLKILKIIFPEIEKMRGVEQGPYHHLDIWLHSLETVKQLEILIQEAKRNNEIQDYLNEFITSDRRRKQLIKLGALLHDIGKPDALRHEDGKIKFHGHERIGSDMSEEIAKRLKLSNDELNALRLMVYWHLRPGYLGDFEKPSARAKFRYFRDTDKEAISILLLSLADQRSTKGPLTTKAARMQHERVVSSLLKEYFKRLKEKKPKRLLNGDDLIKKFKLEPSPLIGKILSEVEELQAIAKVKTKKEALLIAKKFIK